MGFVVRFHFTLGYKGTSLENVHVIDGIQKWAVPRSGMYNVQAGEASGGGNCTGNRNGTVYPTKGIVLQVLVGQMGQSTAV